MAQRAEQQARKNLRKAVIGAALYALLFALCPSAMAQQTGKVPRIGYLASSVPTLDSERSGAIRRALRELGYIEGQTITIEYRYAEGKLDRLPELAADLVRLKVDLIVAAGGTGPIRAAKNATKTIPIVMGSSPNDPVDAGIVESLARPGGNITGNANLSGELGGKRLELLKEVVPRASRIAVLHDASQSSVFELKEVLPIAGHALGLTIHPWEIRTTEDLEKVFAAFSKGRPDGLYVPAGPLTRDNRKQIAGLALKSRLPSVYSNRQAVDAGGLMYYGADLTDSYRRVAWYVDKILKGAKPAELPVEQPTKFELLINLKTAKQIGITIPPNVLARADRVIR